MEPRIESCIQSALTSWRHELLLPNIAGIPLFVQHGSVDENVPVTQSRRMCELLSLLGSPPLYHELPGAPHYFDGIMTTPFMRKFYEQIGQISQSTMSERLPNPFRVVAPNSDDMGSRGGIEVVQLEVATSFGYIDAERQDVFPFWKLKTSNVHRFRFTEKISDKARKSVSVDGTTFENVPLESYLVRSRKGIWTVSRTDLWRQRLTGCSLKAIGSGKYGSDTAVRRGPWTPCLGPVTLLSSDALPLLSFQSPCRRLEIWSNISASTVASWVLTIPARHIEETR